MRLRALFALFGILICSPGADASSYRLFESGPVRPVALSPNGEKLFVANTPDGYLEIFDVEPVSGLLVAQQSVPVGLEPVAVAARSDSEVWVVNHLSDSVSIVDVASSPPRVVRTLIVGDEPRDIVFAGSPQRAFITTAHRGQHREHPSLSGIPGTGDPQLTTEGIGRADVWVFDAGDPGAALGGLPVEVLTFFADTPRALATDGDHGLRRRASTPATGPPAINRDFAVRTVDLRTADGWRGSVRRRRARPEQQRQRRQRRPQTGVIVKFERLGLGRLPGLHLELAQPVRASSLPDRNDVFAVDANTLAAGSVFSSVGTILFNMAINPVTGKLYVTNTESRNHRATSKGPGDHGGSTVQGRLSESRDHRARPGHADCGRRSRHLNKPHRLRRSSTPTPARTTPPSTPRSPTVSPLRSRPSSPSTSRTRRSTSRPSGRRRWASSMRRRHRGSGLRHELRPHRRERELHRHRWRPVGTRAERTTGDRLFVLHAVRQPRSRSSRSKRCASPPLVQSGAAPERRAGLGRSTGARCSTTR